MLLAACSSAPHIPSALHEQLDPEVRLKVPFIAQKAYYCGPAALASVAGYRGQAVDQQTVAAMSFVPGRRGSLTLEMQAAGRRLGLLPYPLEGRLSDILRELDGGNPVLVLQNLGLAWWPQWHYAVAVGYRLSDQSLLLHSGEQAYYRLGFSTFNATWARAGHWARVLVDSERVPVTATALPYLKAALAFEQTGQLPRAVTLYRRASQQWPSSVPAWLALANAHYSLGEPSRAIAAYERAIDLAPARAASWNNYAYALHAQGCQEMAMAALGKAATLAPAASGIAGSMAELSRPSASAKGGVACPEVLPGH